MTKRVIANPGEEKGYALFFISAVRHVATEMEAARLAGRVTSIEAMTASYTHPNGADLTRVRHHHGIASNEEATRFLVERAVLALGDRVEHVDNGVRLAKPLTRIRYEGDAIVPTHDPHSRLRDAFNPMSGAFSDNVRKLRTSDRMEDLRESMRAFGWIEELPAIEDERGVVIVGHRRLAVAKELGIEPVVRVVRFGSGDEADARRFRLAIVSNTGAKPFTQEDRARLAEYLYRDREWTMQQIAEALDVSTQTVSRDLSHVEKVRDGRPRTKLTPDQQNTVLELAGQGVPQEQIATQVGVSRMPVRTLIAQEQGRREARQNERKSRSCTCPTCGTAHAIEPGQAVQVGQTA